jgi:hypothetical protein
MVLLAEQFWLHPTSLSMVAENEEKNFIQAEF